jgi:gamma-glutamylcyclotransferase (GGCT)/AIG2-like uncharacterized protein YtfP
MNTPLFVYGTLKRGHCRHFALQGQEFLAEARTRPVYRMYNVGQYPALIRDDDGIAIEGEVWSVDEACIMLLDEVEGAADNWFRRGSVELITPLDDLEVQTYFYQQSVAGLARCGSRWE